MTPPLSATAILPQPMPDPSRDAIRVLHGIPAALGIAAAALYWRHFGAQILPFPAGHRHGIALMRAAMRPDHALVALSPRGRLVGIIGLRDARGGLFATGAQPFQTVWGPAGGQLRHMATRLYRAGPQTADLVLDGIAIRPEWRRLGIARLLVQAAARRARQHGHLALRAEVAAGNRGGLAAWQALGFAPLPRQRLGWPWTAPSHVLRLPI